MVDGESTVESKVEGSESRMKDMDKATLKALLKEHLTIELNESEDMYSKDLDIVIRFDGEEICSSSHRMENKGF